MVQFGTSGWRGIVGQEVTFRRVRIVTQAILEHLRASGREPELVIVGYDTRMLSEKFALAAAQLVAANSVRVEIPLRDVPSPVLASAVRDRGADAGLVFTGSHNPPEYNGLKLYTSAGILAPPEITDQVEERFAELEPDWDDTFIPRRELVGSVDAKAPYLERLQDLIDWEAIRSSGLRFVVDPLFGTTREYLDHILLENRVPVTVIHNTRDPYFGGYAPDCTSANLSRLRDVMRTTGADLGLATDGDGDRFGLLDHGARMEESTVALALILDYLIRRRGLAGRVGRTPATSRLLDAVAADHGVELVERPVGFKSLGPLLADGTIEFACEESAGLAWARHLPERDGVLACLLAAEMTAVEGRTLRDLRQRLFDRVGTYAFRRTQVPVTDELVELLNRHMERDWDEVGGRRVERVDLRDGLGLHLEGGAWILARLSGTEPKLRIYAEGRSQEELRHLMHVARRLFTQRRL
jgi:phosphoglucomutase